MKRLLAILICTAAAPSIWATAFNQNITAIFGTGNTNVGWTTDTAGNIQLGLRAKGRTDTIYNNTTPNNGAGTYIFASDAGARGAFNYEFSINSDTTGGTNLDGYDFFLAVDQDISAGTSFSTVNALTYWTDNSYGNNGTANGAGVEGTAAALAGSNNIAQNSENITFGDYPGGGLALQANATYSYQLYAVAAGAGANGARLVETDITVVIGNGGAAVPDSGSTAALLALGVAGIAGFAFRKRSALV